ncbi:hypothetical protein HRbin26_00122 [bacterium HR26]|nr:hypothetical protein HRbin26_00122 [bacterium HR26]
MSDSAIAHPNSGLATSQAVGNTGTERYLKQLCDRSFLSLWSYAGIYRDQFSDSHTKRNGKEICDVLVVFDNHIVIFSDKHIKFPNTGDLHNDWRRWYKKAIEESAKQVCGAERWIRRFPDRLFVDRSCTKPFPIKLPSPDEAHFHRVVVAHGAADRCRDEVGGSGSLAIEPSVTGSSKPFTVGTINPMLGYVHIFDKYTLRIVLESVDTISDFIEYISKKEKFIQSGKLLWAAGEEDLLAYYLQHFDDGGEKGFVIPQYVNYVVIQEGMWQEFCQHPRRIAQEKANKISYVWDELIEDVARHALDGTQYYTTHPDLSDQERILRLLARENRTRRRLLCQTFADLVKRTPASQGAVRVVLPLTKGDSAYVFLLMPEGSVTPYDEYRRQRREVLWAYCSVVKFLHPDIMDIVGIATESEVGAEGSQDIVYLDGREWTTEDEKEAARLHELGLLQRRVVFKGVEFEYPDPGAAGASIKRLKGRNRNQPCPCGSGRKFKHCCGSRTGSRLYRTEPDPGKGDMQLK